MELLGFAPCYHIEDTVGTPGHLDAWEAVARGDEIDWRSQFAEFRSTADFPACLYFREQLAAFPDARVVPDTSFPHVNERGALDDMLATEDPAEFRAKLRGVPRNDA